MTHRGSSALELQVTSQPDAQTYYRSLAVGLRADYEEFRA